MASTNISRHYSLNKKNKENVQPTKMVKFPPKPNAPEAAALPLQTSANKKEITEKLARVATVKQVVRKQKVEQTSGRTMSTTTTRTVRNTTTGNKQPPRQGTGSLNPKTEITAEPKHPAGEALKPQTASLPPKPAPGMYKGKIVESKIGSIWKSSVPARNEDQKSTVQKSANQRAGNPIKSVAGRGTLASTRPVKHTVNTTSSARPPARSVPTTMRPRNATVAQGRRCGTVIAKPKALMAESRPPVTSTVRQYRASNETDEEKRVKLAEWLASKGKTLKRPAMVQAASTKVKLSNNPAPKSQAQLQMTSKPEVEVKEPKPVTPVLTEDNQGVVWSGKRTSLLMNTTLDLIENSDLDPPVDDIVINLCDALEALVPPSQCAKESPQPKDEGSDEGNEPEESKVDVKCETPDKGTMKCEGDYQEVQVESEESDDDCYVDENAPPAEESSAVKYSVKTTPFLQSVKKTITHEVYSSSSKPRSSIKDIKYLTPVRRSSRIHRHSSRLPAMLVDHDPCVSSLAELVKLDDEANAYIYRKNPALLGDLPDQPRL